MTSAGRFTRAVLPLALVALLVVTAGTGARGKTLRVHVDPDVPDLRGETVSIRLKIMARGVGASPETPLGRVNGRVGETIPLGDLSSTPERPVELRVGLPWGSFYHPVPSEALESGTLRVPVYPPGDSENLSVLHHEVMVQPFPGRLMFREYIVFRNASRRMAGGSADPVTLDLPEGIEGVNTGPGLGSPADLVRRDGRHEYRLMLPPGRSIIGFYYMLRSDENAPSVTRRLTLPTRQLVYSIPSPPGLEVRAEGLSRSDTSGRSGGRRTVRLTGEDLESGHRVQLSFKGLSEVDPSAMRGPSRGDRGEQTRPAQERDRDEGVAPSSLGAVSWPVLLGIGISLVVFAGSYGYVQYRLGNLSTGGRSDFLVDEIARLDQEYEDGAIPEAYYRRTRRRWKKRAREVLDDESVEL